MNESYIEAQDNLFKEKLLTLEGKSYEQMYPYSFPQTDFVSDVRRRYGDIPAGSVTENKVRVAGRLMGRREMGRTTFYDLQENSQRIQLFLSRKESDPLTEPLVNGSIGDLYGIEGNIMKTRLGELSVRVSKATMLARCLRHMPDKWQGLNDPEVIYRNRHLALLTDPDIREVFKKRTATFNSIRKQLDSKGFLEVDTPVLQPIYGGANARPFVTEHNALDQKMFLRISNELYLKRLIIGGIDRVFEFARDFRNEGVDATHNPEFTQLEIYQAYADYQDMMHLVEGLLSQTAVEVKDSTNLDFLGQKIELAPPWKRISMEEAVEQHSGIRWKDLTDTQLKEIISTRNLKFKGAIFSRGRALNSLFEHFVEAKLIQPTIVYDYPEEISPLAKKHRSKEGFVERFEFFIGGREFGNAYSELNDPLDQRRRFEEQQLVKAKGDDEAHPLDEDFLRTMEYGMPPTGGLGIGIDRLVSLLTNQKSIKDVLLFPALKQK